MKQLFLMAFVLFILSACTGTEPGAEPVPTQAVLAEEPVVTEIAQLIETPTPEPTIVPSNTPEPTATAAIPTEIPTSLPNANPEWITHIIDLYPLQLNLPAGWTITEVNRQEEPTDWGLVLGHDCADYIIANSDSTLQIHLLPACGLGEGANFLCPSDTAIIGPSIYPDLHIVRFQFPNSQAFGYTEAGDELMYCADSPRISYRDGDVNSYMLVELDYAGNEAELPQLIEITDEIIRSITAQPRKATGPTLSLEPALALCADVTEIPQIECEALVGLYTQLDGWSLTSSEHGWMQTNTPCSWVGIQCDGQHITMLSLYRYELTGNIPPEIGDLSNLILLDLSGTYLTDLPPEIGNLPNLIHLQLSAGTLTNLSPEMRELTNLTLAQLPEECDGIFREDKYGASVQFIGTPYNGEFMSPCRDFKFSPDKTHLFFTYGYSSHCGDLFMILNTKTSAIIYDGGGEFAGFGFQFWGKENALFIEPWCHFGGDLHIINLDTKDVRYLGAHTSANGDLHWNSTKTAFWVDVARPTTPFHDFWGYDIERDFFFLPELDQPLNEHYAHGQWTPDQSHILYQHRILDYVDDYLVHFPESQQILRVDVSNGEKDVLLNDPLYDYHLCESCVWYGDWVQVQRYLFEPQTFDQDQLDSSCLFIYDDHYKCAEEPELFALNWRTGELIPWDETVLPSPTP